MSSITQVCESMQRILKQRAKEVERETGFVERESAQFDGPGFAQTTVLTWMHTPDASYTQLRHTAASVGVYVSTQAIEQRFSEGSARLLHTLLQEAVAEVISSEARAPEMLARFNGVYLQDGTIISLPARLAQQWAGRGSSGQEAALRVQARLELGSGSEREWAVGASRQGGGTQWPCPQHALARGRALQCGYGLFQLARDAPA